MKIKIGQMYGVDIIFEEKSIKINKTKKSKRLKLFYATVRLLAEPYMRDERFVSNRNRK